MNNLAQDQAPRRTGRPRARRAEMSHPLAPHGWHMEPLVLIEDGSGGPYLASLSELTRAR